MSAAAPTGQAASAGASAAPAAVPRKGAYSKHVQALHKDQLSKLQAKNGQEIDKLTCANPVAQQYSMGDEFGVTGTPAIIYETGYLQSGYAPAAEMARRLGVLN